MYQEGDCHVNGVAPLQQGNCTLVVETGEDGEEVGVVEGGAEALGGEAALRRTLLAEEIAGEVAQHRQILGPVADADPTFVLAEGHVEDPVDTILDPPVPADDPPEGCRVASPAEQVVARLDADRGADPTLALDQADGASARPGMALVEVGDGRRVADGPVAPRLDAPVVLLDRRPMVMVGRGVVGEGGGTGLGEHLGDRGVRRRMVVLQRQRVIGTLADDLGGDGGLAAQRVDGHRRPAQVEQPHQGGDGGDLVGLLPRPPPARAPARCRTPRR